MKKFLLVVALLVPALAGAQTPTGTVSGQILNREGRPASAVRVSAVAVPETGAAANSGTALVSIAMTDSEGRYRLENVLPGHYYIMAGFVDLPSYYPGVASTSDARVVNVLSGTPVTGINFTVANSVGVTVSGRVRRATGTGGVSGQRVALIGGIPPVQEATTTADGSFRIPRVRPGTYQLTATGQTAASSRFNQRLTVVVGDSDVTGLEMVIVPTVDVTGNVVIEGAGPLPRIQLQLSPFKGTGQNTGMSTTPDGSIRATLSEGDYRVSWTNLPVGYEIKSITAGNVDLLAAPLKVSVDAPPPAVRVLVSVEGNPWVRVSGRVTNVGSTRTLSLMGPNVDQIQVTVNPDGSFEIAQALPGTYQLRPNPTQPSLVMQPISVVIPNQGTTNLIISLPATKDIQGIVVNSNGAGVEGRFMLNYSQNSGTSISSGGRSIATQRDGKFTLEVPAGADMRLTVNVPGYTVKSATYGTVDLVRENIRVTATDTAEIRVVLDTTSTAMTGAAVGGGVAGGVFSSSIGIAPPPPPPPPPPPAPVRIPASAAGPSPTVTGNRIGEPLSRLNLISSAPPAYPPLASTAGVQGTVVLQVEISIEGRVQNVSVVSGHALLNQAVIDAVRQWTYKPFVLNGQTIPVTTTVTVTLP